MNEVIIRKEKNKGGRPKKKIKQDAFIGVKCSLIDKTVLKRRARTVGLSLSEYLREAGLKGQAVSKIKALPREVLLFTATLNHLAANLNQVAKKRNQLDELSATERAELNELSARVKQLTIDVKNYLL